MDLFKFDDAALEKISKRRQNKSKLFIVFGYQFESNFYDVDNLRKNLTDRISKLQCLFSDIDDFEINIDFKPLKGGLGKHVFEDILVDIASSDIAFFEVSDQNPNVFLEMGVALSHGVAIIPLKHKDSGKIPSDISGLMWVVYEDSGKVIHDGNFDTDLLVLIKRIIKKKVDQKDILQNQ